MFASFALTSHSRLCCYAMPGEGLYQVLETVESGLLAADDDADDNGDVSGQKPVTSDPGIHDNMLQNLL